VTPLERLTAAIEKLERLKAESTGPNLWLVDPDNPSIVLHPDKAGESWDGKVIADTGTDELGLPVTPADARLIVTLHRTIDAQLTILRHAAARAQSKIAHGARPDPTWSHEFDALALADAVLGTTE
jgi:hypothetical protein